MIADDHYNEQNIWLVIFQAWTIQDIALERPWQWEDIFKNANWYSRQTWAAPILFILTRCVDSIWDTEMDLSFLSYTLLSNAATFPYLLYYV